MQKASHICQGHPPIWLAHHIFRKLISFRGDTAHQSRFTRTLACDTAGSVRTPALIGPNDSDKP